MKITLEIENNKEKTFSTVKMRGRILKRLLEIQDIMEEASENEVFTQEHYDLMISFICDAFGNQFTEDEFLDGMELEETYPTFAKLAEEISKRTMKKVKDTVKN